MRWPWTASTSATSTTTGSTTLDLILDQARRSEDEQRQTAGMLDQRAAALLGFDGVLVTILAGQAAPGWSEALAGALALGSAAFAVFSYRFLPQAALDPQAMLTRYADTPVDDVRAVVAATSAALYGQRAERIRWKFRAVGASGWLLAGSVAITVIFGTIVDADVLHWREWYGAVEGTVSTWFAE